MSNRDEQLAKGLAELHESLAGAYMQIERIQSLVPVFDFGDVITNAESAEERAIDGLSAEPPQHEKGLYQVPMFDVPMVVIFENVTINGETVDLAKEQNNERD